MSESTEPATPETPTPVSKRRNKVIRTPVPTVQAPTPPPLVDFGEPLPSTSEPVQDEPEASVPASEPVAPAGDAPVPQPVAQTHLSPFLVTMAKSYGLADDDLKAMSQVEVERYVQHVHQREAWISENLLKNNPGDRSGAGAAPSPAPPPAPEPEPEIDLGLDDTYPTEIKEAIKKAAKAKDKEIAELKEIVNSIRGETRATKQKALLRAFDEAFVELGDAYGEYYGKGSASDGLLSQEQKLKRQYVTMAITEDDTPEEAKQKIRAITRLLYGNGVVKAPEPAPAPTPLEIAKKEYETGTTAKPIQRDPPKVPFGVTRAVKSVEEFMQKRQMIPTYSGTNGDSEDTKL